MALLYSAGNAAGPYSTFQCISELIHLSTDSTGYNVRLHRYIHVQGGTSGFRGTTVSTSWAGSVALYQTGTYAETNSDFHIDYGTSYTMPGISAQYTSGSGNTYRSATGAQTYNLARPTYTVRYDANGGNGAPSSQTKAYGYDLTLSSTRPERDGYNFLGWSTSSTATTATYQPGGTYTANSGTTLYAVWAIKVFSVTFDAETNGGTINGVGVTSASRNWGEQLGELPLPEKQNNEFIEWNTIDDGSGEKAEPTDIIYSDRLLFAIYKLKANCYIRQNGAYKPAMMYKKENGTYKTGEIRAKANGEYKPSNM